MSHDLRVTALTNIGRGWPTMTRGESAAQFKWYLHHYADTSSDRDTTIPTDCWGGSAILGFAAPFLQPDIYVLNCDGDRAQWSCRKFHPYKMNLHGRVVVAATEHPLSVMSCIDDLQAAKIDMTVSPPLILRLGGRHYSAYLHSDHDSDPLSIADSRTDQVTIGPQDTA